jgi:2-keto-3-deoxy-L-rhamnonate aldolase RhmA
MAGLVPAIDPAPLLRVPPIYASGPAWVAETSPAMTPRQPARPPINQQGHRMGNVFKDKLKRDEVVVVVNPDHPSPSLTEFVAGLGFDGIFVDCEHGMASVERVQEMCRAARAAGVQSIVRPETGAPWLITRYLDAGAGGVMVPHIETAAAARDMVAAVRYARPRDHADKVVIAMIESVGAIDALPALLEIDGIDVFFIGPNDLSQSMGLPGQIHHPDVKGLTKATIGRIRAGGRTAGTLVVRDTAAEFVAAGCRYLYEHANNFLAAGAGEFRRRLDGGAPS